MEGDGEADRGTHGSGGCCMGKTAKVAKSNAGSEAELKALTHSILKKIKEKQLEVLLQAVESKGGARSPCLLLPSKVDAKVGQQSYSLPMLLYKVFRWPDLRHSSELKRLSCCESYGKINPELVCCNPHHMSRLCELGESRIVIQVFKKLLGLLLVVGRRESLEIVLKFSGGGASFTYLFICFKVARVCPTNYWPLKGIIRLIQMTSPLLAHLSRVSIRSNLTDVESVPSFASAVSLN